MNKNQQLKKQITNIDYIFQGTIIKQFKRCGKKTCRCNKGRDNWHGPYWIWTRKEKGKTITKTLKNKKQSDFVKTGFKNLKKLNQVLEKWKNQSLTILADE